MEKTETGGPAFPNGYDVTQGQFEPHGGMTLRDYFAAQVLVGLSIRREGKCNQDDARNAYALADAMIKARTGGAS